MATRSKFFSWSKGRQSGSAEPYHRTGGLLPIIDTSVGDHGKEVVLANSVESTFAPGRRRPPNLTIVPPDSKSNDRSFLSPASAQRYAAKSKSVSNLLAVVDDMLRSPVAAANLCSSTSSGLHKPLPSRPRSMSLPSTPEPVELPGSILLDNQGFPPPSPVVGSSWDTMRPVRSGNAVNSSCTARPIPSQVTQARKSLSETSLQRRPKSRPNLVTSPSSDSKLTSCSVSTANGDQTSSASSSRAQVGADQALQESPVIVERKPWRRKGSDATTPKDDLGASVTSTPTAARSRQVDELKATITAQDQTISTLQAQFASLRVSHEAHVASLVDAHAAEIASLRNYTKALEDQQSQRTLHHASSNHLLFLLDTTDQPQSPTRETPQTTAGATSASSIRSFRSAFEQQSRASPVRPRDSPEMENLKRKLSAARRPEVGNGDAVRELNMYKSNCGALQRQIDLLMTKLNESKTAERELKRVRDELQKSCEEYQEKASKVEQVEKGTAALQNTIDHLEYRLEVANADKLDAEEQLFNLQRMRSMFDPKLPPGTSATAQKLDTRQSTRTSMSTVFANESPINEGDMGEPKTLSAFIARIERLQEQVREKDERNTKSKVEQERLRRSNEQLRDDNRDLKLQLDIQASLLTKARQDGIHIEELRSAIMQREAIIGEKVKALAMVERQLNHHKLLLQAEVKRHAMFKLYGEVEEDPLPDLSALTSKDDITRWVDRLKKRLKQEKAERKGLHVSNDLESKIQELQHEIDFYVMEIIYFKLDCRGYKSDIKKLKKIAAQMGTRGGRPGDVDSPDPSVCRSTDTPVLGKRLSVVSGLGISGTPSPVSTGPISASVSIDRPVTPPSALIQETAQTTAPKPTKRVPKQLDLRLSVAPRTPPRLRGINTANEVDDLDPGVSPKSVARLSPERRKPTPPSPDQEKFGDLATNFPLSTPAAPKRHGSQAGMEDSAVSGPRPRTPEKPPYNPDGGLAQDRVRSRSNSTSSQVKGRMTPERPPRPRIGLFESPIGASRIAPPDFGTPPRMDVMAEAMRNSPERVPPPRERKFSNSSASNVPFPSATHDAPSQPRERKFSNSSASNVPFPSATHDAPPPPRERKFSNSSASNVPFPASTHDALRSSSAASGSLTPQAFPLRSREGSAISSTNLLQPGPTPSSPHRRPSTSSSANVPFVISMGSPHNPALITPTATVQPTSCPITRNNPAKITIPTSRTGVGGTMASTTPVTSPTSPTEPKSSYFSAALPSSKFHHTPSTPSKQAAAAAAAAAPSPSKPARPARPASTSPSPMPRPEAPHTHTHTSSSSTFNGGTSSFAAPTASSRSRTSPAHSRNVSGSSIRSAITSGLPGRMDFMKGKGKSRKESISHPTPLASPFDIDRSMAGEGGNGRG